MCHQTVSLVARVLEAGGICTVVFSNARDITERACTPRAVFSNFPLGNPCGRPGDAAAQRDTLIAGLRLVESARESGTLLDRPDVWSESRRWMDLIFSPEQPFLSETAEARRRATIEKARAQSPD